MADLLVIFGITGQQGSSVATHVLDDAELSKRYKLRGITRDPFKEDAQALAKRGVELVKAELDDAASLQAALKGAHTVYAMTVSQYVPGGQEREVAQGKAIADATVAAGAQLLIFSTTPSPKKFTDGKFPVGSFDCKDEVKSYIEQQPIRSAFFAPGTFMQNLHSNMAPHPGPDGQLALTNFVKPDTGYALIDIADTGKFVGAILADPAAYAGKTVCAATRIYPIAEMADILSKAVGKPVKYNQVPKEVFSQFLPEPVRDTLLNMFSYFEYCGYFGPETSRLVSEAAANARGRPTTLEEYLQREPLKL